MRKLSKYEKLKPSSLQSWPFHAIYLSQQHAYELGPRNFLLLFPVAADNKTVDIKKEKRISRELILICDKGNWSSTSVTQRYIANNASGCQ